MVKTTLEILEKVVKDYESDIQMYERLILYNSEVMMSNNPEIAEMAVFYSMDLVTKLDQVRLVKLPEAEEAVRKHLAELEEEAQNDQDGQPEQGDGEPQNA